MSKPLVVVPESLRKNLRPRRALRGSAVAPTQAAVPRLWKKIASSYGAKKVFGGDTTHAKIYAAGLKTDVERSLANTRLAAHKLLLSPSTDAVQAATVDALAASEQMLRRAVDDATLLSAVAVTRGLPDALRVALRATDFSLASDHGYTTDCYVVSAKEPSIGWNEPWLPLRHALCAASQEEYDAVKKLAGELRGELDLARRALVAYAFPDEPWADEDLLLFAKASRKDVGGAAVLLSATTSMAGVRAYVDATGGEPNLAPFALDLVQFVPEGELLPVLAAELPRLLAKPKYGPLLKTPPRMIAEAIGCFRSPAAAAVLAEYVNHPVMSPLVLAFFRDAPELGSALERAAGARLAPSVDRVLGRGPHQEHAPAARAAEIPAILVEKPWRATPPKLAKARKPLSLEIVAAHESVSLPHSIVDYETTAKDHIFRDMTHAELAAWKKEVAADSYVCVDYDHHRRRGANATWEYRRVPDVEGIDAWNRGSSVGLSQSPLQWIARHGCAVLEGFTKRDWLKWLGWDGDDEYLTAATSFVSPRIAPDIARALHRKRARRAALTWLGAYAECAALGLIPNAVGVDGEAKREAEFALTHLARTGHRAAVETAAQAYGKDACQRIAALLDRDPLAIGVTPPKPPPFLRLSELSQVTLKSGRSIGDDARDALVELLQVTPPDVPYPGVEVVRQSCAEESLSRLAQELLEQWVLGDLPGRHEWMLLANVHFPSEAGTRRIVGLAREWARKNAPKASRLCAALAAIGSDAALQAVAHVADTTRYDALAKEASSLVEEAAAARGLTTEELGDRTVPDVGIDAATTLSFGAREFAVSLDEALSPVVREKTETGLGPPMSSLPRAQKQDDSAQSKSARERFAAWKVDLALIGQRQVRRMERALVDERCWSAEEFRARIAAHPLLCHLARRLVWEALRGKSSVRAFRVAEDGSLADAEDNLFVLDGRESVRLWHPARPGSTTEVWARLWSDYEVLQPFAQVGRRVYVVEERERQETSLVRTAGLKVAPKKLLGVLESRGWKRDNAGHVSSFRREVRDAQGTAIWAVLPMTPGFEIAELRDAAEVETGALVVHEAGGEHPLPLERLSSVCFSELVLDVLSLGESSKK